MQNCIQNCPPPSAWYKAGVLSSESKTITLHNLRSGQLHVLHSWPALRAHDDALRVFDAVYGPEMTWSGCYCRSLGFPEEWPNVVRAGGERAILKAPYITFWINCKGAREQMRCQKNVLRHPYAPLIHFPTLSVNVCRLCLALEFCVITSYSILLSLSWSSTCSMLSVGSCNRNLPCLPSRFHHINCTPGRHRTL